VIAAWMLFAIATGCVLTVAAAAADRVALLLQRPRRFIWVTAMVTTICWPALSLVLPAILHFKESATSDLASFLSETSHVTSIAISAPLIEIDPRWNSALLAVWALVSSVLLTRYVVALRHIRRSRGSWRAMEIDGITVQVAADAGPAVIGLHPMHVVMPKWILGMEPGLRTLVLRHEVEHRTAGDPYLLLAATLLTALFPWNGALWLQRHRLRLAIEMDCDARVLRADPRWREYARLLLTIAQRQAVAAEPLTLALAEHTSNLERRIVAMRTSSTHAPFRVVCFSVTAAAAFGLACSVDRPESSDPAKYQSDPRDPASATSAGQSPDTATSPFLEFQVDKPVVLRESAPPRYPADLKQSGVSGEVWAQYVVDETGRINMETFKVLKSPDPRLTDAVKMVLPTWRLEPATRRGKKVRQLVQQSFVFAPSDGA